MAETWEKIFRQVALKGNLLKASVAATLETNYTNVSIGAAEMSDRGVQFPKTAVDDAILAAGDRIVRRIGANPNSRYRKNFHDVTADIASGGLIPLVGSTGAPTVGVIGAVKDTTTGEECERVTRQQVDSYGDMVLKQGPHFYSDDGVRIWHTRVNVKADVIVWSKSAQLALLSSTPRGACPFTEDLHECLVSGGLAYLFRSTNNAEQAEQHKVRFDQSLDEIFVEV